jgi:hypothetical protein
MRNISDKFVGEIKKKNMLNKFFSKIVPFMRYVETMVVPDRPQMAIKCCTCALHGG